jgi:hypothetical protein
VQARFGSFDEKRATLDVNRRITSNFGVRANFLWQDSDGYREFEFNEKKAGHLAATYRPFPKTTIKVEYEKAEYSENRARPWTPVDRYSGWERAGRPAAGTPTTWGTAIPGGAVGAVSGNTILYFSEGVLANQTLWTTGTQLLRVSNGPPTVPGLNTSVNILDETLVPRNANIAGPGARSDSHFDVGSAALEQQIGEDLFVEVAMNAEYEERLWANPIGFADLAYRLDANAYLPTFNAAGVQTGIVANPDFGRPMAFGTRTDRHMKFYREQYRATASYNLKFDQLLKDNSRLAWWLGTHRLAVMASQEGFERDIRNTREVNVSPNRVNPLQLNGNNSIVRVSYLDYFSGDRALRGHRDPSLHPITSQRVANNPNAMVEAGFVNTGWTWQKNELETQMFAMQNFLFDQRIVTTFGWRKDELTVYSADTVRADNNNNQPATGFIRRGGPDRVIPGDTFTRGIVAHVRPWLSVYYNESDNFTSQDAVQLFGTSGQSPVVGNRTGEGKDAGIKTRFFQDKVHATLGWYRTADTNQVSFINGVYPNWIEGIWDAVGQAVDLEGRDTRSLKSEGYELEITANPTRQLRFSVNVKKAETTVDGLLPTVAAYIAANRSAWLSSASAPIDTTRFGGLAPTVGEAVAQVEQQLMIDRAPEGSAPFQDREITGSLFGTYRFDTGPLDGFTFGGGAQYRGPALITYRVATDGRPVYTDAYTQANAMLAYSRKLSRGIDFRVQLNVDNLFDFQDPQPVAGGQPAGATTLPLIEGVAYTVSLPIPRRYSVTLSFRF